MIGNFLKQGFTVLQHLYYTTIKGGAWASTALKCELGDRGVVLQESVNSYYCFPHTDLTFTALKLLLVTNCTYLSQKQDFVVSHMNSWVVQ